MLCINVYLGLTLYMLQEYQIAGRYHKNKPLVAVGITLRSMSDTVALDFFSQEISVRRSLNHNSIVNLVAVCPVQPMIMLLEYCIHGSLRSFVSTKICEAPQRMTMALDICSAMVYLRTQGRLLCSLQYRVTFLVFLYHKQ